MTALTMFACENCTLGATIVTNIQATTTTVITGEKEEEEINTRRYKREEVTNIRNHDKKMTY